MTITAWTQDAAFNLSEKGVVTLDQATALIHSYEWGQQCTLCGEAAQKGGDACPPAVGFSEGKNMFQLFCETADAPAIRLELVQTKKILGIFPRPLYSRIFRIYDLREAEPLLGLFFSSSYEQLMREAQKHPAQADDMGPLF